MTSLYSQSASKRQKTTREVTKSTEQNEYFPGVGVVEHRPDAGVEETLCYRHYNPTERVHGRTMEDWMRPAVSFHHAFRARNSKSGCVHPWDDAGNTVDACKRRVRAAFELYAKLGVRHWTLLDRDVAPEGDGLEETGHHLDEVSEVVLELQQKTGVKPLWVAADLHSHYRYANGSATNPEATIATYAGAQLKRSMDLAHKLGAECFVFQGRREGYASVLTADLTRDLHNYARQLKMAANYKERLGYRGQLLFQSNGDRGRLEDKDEFHYYDADAMSAMYLLKHNNLERNYKLSVAPGHQLFMTSAYGMLGSIDVTNLKSLPSVNDATLLMKTVIEQGGMQPGGLNIGLDLHRQSTDVKELMVAYVACIDVYARGLRNAAKIVADGVFAKNLQQRYLSYHTGFGSRLANGEASLEDCEDHVRKQRVEIVPTCSRQQHWTALFNHYI